MGLILLAAPVGALIPDKIEILDPSPDDWVTAGSGEPVTITARVLSNTPNSNTPVGGVAVEFTLDGGLGSISSAQAVTDNNTGYATTVFTPGTTSGDVTITATVALDAPLEDSVDLHIDHAVPYKIANLWYEPEVIAGETTEIVVRMVDRYGNVIDCRNIAESVKFMVGSPEGGEDAIFDDPEVDVDSAGDATATLRVGTMAGENLVWIQPPKTVKGEYISIAGVAGPVVKITQVVDPSSASVPADGDKVVSFTYTLFDEYANPAAGQELLVSALVKRVGRPEELQTVSLHSNSHGQVMITYGPEDSVGIATITATVSADENVHVSKDVVFTSTAPVDMLLSASPQSMPSRDVKENSVSQLRAKVMDESGNPVEGETVTFETIPESIVVGDYVATGNPYLGIEGQMNGVTAETNEDGYAIVKFHPGAFTTDRDAEGWSATATGTAIVQAKWVNDAGDRSATQDITLTWKNYPYLSVETAVSPETVAVDEAVDVTIRLRGDGWALQPDPIDVVLVIDRSGSMLRDKPDRMHSVREAAKAFVNEFSENHDRAGVVSFGRKGTISTPGEKSGLTNYKNNDYACPKTYDNYATLDAGLTYNLQTVKDALDGIVPDHGTPLRQGLKVAIDHLDTNAYDGSVRAVVLLSDGDYNWYGDPLARGSSSTASPDDYGDLTQGYYKFSDLMDAEQNLSFYAKSKGVTIYSIGYANSISTNGKSTLKKLAESTGGLYYDGDAANIGAVYTAIAGELKTEAGVDTELDVVFRDVEVNGAPVGSEIDVFDYVYEDEISTIIKSWIDDDDVGHYVIGPHTIDQTEDWEGDHSLNFNIGTIRLGQTWETTFRLKVLEEGNINVFGPGSTITFNNAITFNNGADTLELPDTFITAVPDLNNLGITSCSLKVELGDPIPPEEQGAFYDTIPLTWTVTYDGTRDIDEALAYSDDNGRSWTVFWTKTIDRSAEPGETLTGETQMDVSSLPAGEYLIRLVASALDAPDAVDTTSTAIRIGNASRDYIMIG
ncbi:VWA domain-containing protein [Methanoculleus sp.]|uniref:VWA domain-containing protein n=1 Tax=Methanoculleus sp. TaxID=90427 RepID=UPI002FC8FD35